MKNGDEKAENPSPLLHKYLRQPQSTTPEPVTKDAEFDQFTA